MSATVLVVEDEADVMLTFRIVLQTAGYEVVEASTGCASSRGEIRPGPMIVDLRLPGIDGWQVLASIRQAGLLAHTPIIIASANANPDQRAKADQFGCAALFTKPFSAEHLRRTLPQALLASAAGSP